MGNVTRLIKMRFAGNVQDFLERNHVGVQLTNDFSDSLGLSAPVHATALVDVIGGNSNSRSGTHLLLTFQHPAQQFWSACPDWPSLPFLVGYFAAVGKVFREILLKALSEAWISCR